MCGFIFGNFGCASIERTSLLGVGSGAVVGGLAASSMATSDHQKRTTNGAVAGAVLGGLTAYIIHRVIDRKESRVRRETLFNLESHGITTGFDGVDIKKFNTFVSSPQVREDYVETHTEDDGRVLIQGHKRWKIIGNPQFNLARPKKREGK